MGYIKIRERLSTLSNGICRLMHSQQMSVNSPPPPPYYQHQGDRRWTINIITMGLFLFPMIYSFFILPRIAITCNSRNTIVLSAQKLPQAIGSDRICTSGQLKIITKFHYSKTSIFVLQLAHVDVNWTFPERTKAPARAL